ncbi:hypothetical protein ACHAXS_001079 [Conticribra weissflogii]
MMLSSKRKNSVYIAVPAADVNDLYNNYHHNDKRAALPRSKNTAKTAITITIVGSGFIAMFYIMFFSLNLQDIVENHSCQHFRKESNVNHHPTFHPYIRNHDPMELQAEHIDAARTMFRPIVTSTSKTLMTAGRDEVDMGMISRDNDTRQSLDSSSSRSPRRLGRRNRKNRLSLLPASVSSSDRSKSLSSKDTEEEDYFVSDVLPLPIPRKNGMPRFVVPQKVKSNS